MSLLQLWNPPLPPAAKPTLVHHMDKPIAEMTRQERMALKAQVMVAKTNHRELLEEKREKRRKDLLQYIGRLSQETAVGSKHIARDTGYSRQTIEADLMEFRKRNSVWFERMSAPKSYVYWGHR